MHLAERNFGRLEYPVGDPRMADFVGNPGKVNAVAERMFGFVWRLVGDDGNGGASRPVGNAPTLAEATRRTVRLETNGNSDQAIDGSHLEHVKLWQGQRCGQAG